MAQTKHTASASDDAFFTTDLATADADIAKAIGLEMTRQQDGIELIASENIVSKAVLEAQGSVLTNKYAEGYPSKRYYGGCAHVDVIEELAIARAKRLFDCAYANVQPNSGSQANQAVLQALVQPGDTIMGMSLDAGGHLTHGSAVSQSGRWFNAVQYGVREDDQRIDYDALAALAAEHKPKLIIAGGSAYSRVIDFARFREIADSVGAYLHVDMAHIAGLVAGGAHPSPLAYAHVATSTTHKTLRGPRGGLIVSNEEGLSRKFNAALFPGIQGGPLMHVIAGKAVAFGEALAPEYKIYIRNVVENARALADKLQDHGFTIVSGGTDNHLVLVDLRSKGLTGNVAEQALERAGITCNKNGIPFDPEGFATTSGVRLGTPAATTRGFGIAQFQAVADMIAETLDAVAKGDSEKTENAVRQRVSALCAEFPIY